MRGNMKSIRLGWKYNKIQPTWEDLWKHLKRNLKKMGIVFLVTWFLLDVVQFLIHLMQSNQIIK